MKIYKDRQFLIFDFEDGKTVKYDFATKTCIGKKGEPVANLCSQLRGLTINELCDSCTDKQYGKFLHFVKQHGDYGNRGVINIGTILKKVPEFSHFEQFFSAGIEDSIDRNFSYKIGDIPKGLLKICKTHRVILNNKLYKYYKENPDAYTLAYNLEYISLDDGDIKNILIASKSEKEYYGDYYWQYTWKEISFFNKLLKDYGYTAKALMSYVDELVTYEALGASDAIREIYDYAAMMSEISAKFDRYPRHFLTTHRIASRNYTRLKEKFDEERFKNRIDKSMEKTFGEYSFIYPESTQDIKDEATSQNNCVASYIGSVINGNCHILFLRRKDEPDKSLVTIEVRNGKIVQAKQRFNYPVTKEQQEIIDKWENWYAKKNESEELKNAD